MRRIITKSSKRSISVSDLKHSSTVAAIIEKRSSNQEKTHHVYLLVPSYGEKGHFSWLEFSEVGILPSALSGEYNMEDSIGSLELICYSAEFFEFGDPLEVLDFMVVEINRIRLTKELNAKQ